MTVHKIEGCPDYTLKFLTKEEWEVESVVLNGWIACKYDQHVL